MSEKQDNVTVDNDNSINTVDLSQNIEGKEQIEEMVNHQPNRRYQPIQKLSFGNKLFVAYMMVFFLFIQIVFVSMFSFFTFIFIPVEFMGDESQLYIGSGPPDNVSHYIGVENTEPLDNYYLTYVKQIYVDTIGVKAITGLHNILNSDYPLVPDGYIYSNDLFEEIDTINKDFKSNDSFSKIEKNLDTDLMGSDIGISINNAIYNSYQYLNKDLELENEGLIVLDIRDDGEYATNVGNLQAGDYIYEIELQSVSTLSDVKNILYKNRHKESVQVKVKRNGISMMIEQNIIMDNGKPYLGIYVQSGVSVKIPEDIHISATNLQGPSAGLLFTLYLIDIYSDEDLAKGYKIAGTGTIEPDGSVGQIGGVTYKLQGAIQNNMDIFFVPKDNYYFDSNEYEAKRFLREHNLKDKIKLVPVSNYKEAVDYLKSLPPKQK